jgi:hypothetical protein
MNGRFTFSNVVSIAVKNNSIEAKTFPNPFINQLQVDLNCTQNKKVTINITDASGKRLIQKMWMVLKGNNSIILSEVKQLTAGVYFIDIRDEDGLNLYKSILIKN